MQSLLDVVKMLSMVRRLLRCTGLTGAIGTAHSLYQRQSRIQGKRYYC
jgi:hypothetical protein